MHTTVEYILSLKINVFWNAAFHLWMMTTSQKTAWL